MMAVASGHSRDFGVCGWILDFGGFADRSSNAGYAYLRLWGGMGGISAATRSHGTVQDGGVHKEYMLQNTWYVLLVHHICSHR